MPTDALNLDSAIYYLLWAVVWLAPGLVTALIASEKGRSVWLWLVLGVLLSWIALVAVIVLPEETERGKPAAPDVEAESDSEVRKGAEQTAEDEAAGQSAGK